MSRHFLAMSTTNDVTSSSLLKSWPRIKTIWGWVFRRSITTVQETRLQLRSERHFLNILEAPLWRMPRLGEVGVPATATVLPSFLPANGRGPAAGRVAGPRRRLAAWTMIRMDSEDRDERLRAGCAPVGRL